MGSSRRFCGAESLNTGSRDASAARCALEHLAHVQLKKVWLLPVVPWPADAVESSGFGLGVDARSSENGAVVVQDRQLLAAELKGRWCPSVRVCMTCRAILVVGLALGCNSREAADPDFSHDSGDRDGGAAAVRDADGGHRSELDAATAMDAVFPEDGGRRGGDGGPADDAGPPLDGGMSMDGAVGDDGGRVLDSGIAADAGGALDSGADAGPPPVLPPGSICGLPPLPGDLFSLEEDAGFVDSGVNNYAFALFRGLYHQDPDHPITYLITFTPEYRRLSLSSTFRASREHQNVDAYWTAVRGVPAIAVRHTASGGLYSVRREKDSGVGDWHGWVQVYVGSHAGDRPPRLDPADSEVVCNTECGTHSSPTAPVSTTVGSVTFDVPGDDEQLTFGVPAGHVFEAALDCPGGQMPALRLNRATGSTVAMIDGVFAWPGGIASVNTWDQRVDPTPYSCTLRSMDYGPDEPPIVVSVEESHLPSTCTMTRVMALSGDEETLRILQPVGHGYVAEITPLGGATLTIEAHDRSYSRDDFNVTTTAPHRVAHNPSSLYTRLRLTSDSPTARVRIHFERGPIDEDAGATSVYSIPPLALDTAASGVLFGRDSDRFRPSVTAGRLYEVVLTPTSGTDDLELTLEDPDRRTGGAAVVETGGAGVTERRRFLARSTGPFVVAVQEERTGTLPTPVRYTVEVRDLGPEN